MWAVFAILSAVFAALTSTLAKIGIDGVNSNLATASAISWISLKRKDDIIFIPGDSMQHRIF